MSYNDFYRKSDALLKKNVREIEFRAGEDIVNQGDNANKIVLLLQGKVKVVHHNSKGDEFIIGFFKDDELFGHMESHTGVDYVATVRCVSDCKVAFIPSEAYFHWFKNDSDFALFVHKGISEHVLKDSKRIVENNFFPLEYHILKYIIQESNDFSLSKIQFSRTELAAYTGAQLRSVNRILKSLVDDKLIQIEKTDILILNKMELEQRFMRNL